MSKVAIITMVQAADLPYALSSLASLRQARGAGDLHLVLLNDKQDAALAAKLADASGGDIIEAGRNLGVAGGRNLLIREAMRRGAKYILSIDDDVLVPPDFAAILRVEFDVLAANGRKPGILTAATLDYHAVGAALFSGRAASSVRDGGVVATPMTSELRRLLAARSNRRTRDIYHMGIVDWRGAYFYSGSPEERSLQRAYGVEPERLSGAQSHLRHAEDAWGWIIDGAAPLPIDTAPGGVCFYPAAAAEEIGFHDECFNPFGFEDADFALRVRAAGYQNFCAPRAVAIHDIAARLSERPLSVLRATQGKMAGAFARKHAENHESATAFFAMTRRIVEQATLGERPKSANGAMLQLPARLEALAAYLGNALLFLLPTEAGVGASNQQRLLEMALDVLQAIIPGSENLTLVRDGGRLKIGGPEGIEVDAASAMTAAGAELRLSVARARISRQFMPPLLSAIADDEDLQFDIELAAQCLSPRDFRVDKLAIRAPGAFELTASGNLSRCPKPPDGTAPLNIERLDASLRDHGAFARVLRLLAAIEGKSPAAFMAQLEAAARSPALKLWLRGEAPVLEMGLSGVIDGVPGPLSLAAAFKAGESGVDNPSVAALWTDFAECPIAAAPADADSPATESISMKLKSFVRKVVADDPAISPYPDNYYPPKALRLARRARYYAAARGVPLTANEAKIVSFRNRHRGERAFIIGNGPSLNLIDLTKLRGEKTFGVNAIYLNREKMGFLPTHHIVEDIFVAEDRAAEINALAGPHKWYGHYLRYCLDQTPDVCWLNVACDYRNYPGFPHFSTNAARIVWVGGTVSYIALQLAYYMGFDEVVLVGFDHSYSIPKEARVEGRAITSTSDDPNHFHPDYFGKGYRWHDPRVDRMEKAYRNARKAYESAGRRIVNATPGGALEVFERADFQSLFRA